MRPHPFGRWRTALGITAVVTSLVACASSYTAGSLPPPRSPDAVPTHADPVAGPAVTGRVVDASGAPVAGATVVLAVALSGTEQFFNGMAGLASAGTLCAFGACSGPSKQTYSAQDGSFAVAVPGPNKSKDNYYLAPATGRGAGQVGTRLTLPATAAGQCGWSG